VVLFLHYICFRGHGNKSMRYVVAFTTEYANSNDLQTTFPFFKTPRGLKLSSSYCLSMSYSRDVCGYNRTGSWNLSTVGHSSLHYIISCFCCSVRDEKLRFVCCLPLLFTYRRPLTCCICLSSFICPAFANNSVKTTKDHLFVRFETYRNFEKKDSVPPYA